MIGKLNNFNVFHSINDAQKVVNFDIIIPNNPNTPRYTTYNENNTSALQNAAMMNTSMKDTLLISLLTRSSRLLSILNRYLIRLLS